MRKIGWTITVGGLLLGLGPVAAAHAQTPDGAAGRLLFTLPADLRAVTLRDFERTGAGPALTATSDAPAIRLLVARAAHDTALVRDLLADATLRLVQLGVRNAPPPVLLAESELWLGDSAAAQARLDSFAQHADEMDQDVAWDGITNGTWLERANALRARLAHTAVATPPAGSAPVLLRIPARGTFRFRYDLTLWTRPAVAIPAFDSIAPTTRLALLTEEVFQDAPDTALTQTVVNAAIEIPLLARMSDAGLAALRGLSRGLRSAHATLTLDRRGRVRTRETGSDAAAPWAALASDLLAALGPLGLMPPLPETAVRPGEAWTDTVTVRVPGTVLDAPIRVPATMRLTAVQMDGGRATAAITVSARTRHAVLPDGSTVDLTLTAETVADLDAGVPVRTAASLRALVRDPRGAVVPVRVLFTALRQPTPGAGAVLASVRP